MGWHSNTDHKHTCRDRMEGITLWAFQNPQFAELLQISQISDIPQGTEWWAWEDYRESKKFLLHLIFLSLHSSVCGLFWLPRFLLQLTELFVWSVRRKKAYYKAEGGKNSCRISFRFTRTLIISAFKCMHPFNVLLEKIRIRFFPCES